MKLCSKDIMFSAAGGLRTLFADVYKSAENSGNIFNCLHAEVVSLLYRAFESAADPENEQNCCEAVNAIVRLTPGKTLLEDSVTGHRIVFLAEKSRLANGAMLDW